MDDPIKDELLDLLSLAKGRPGITPAWGQSLAEAAVICLEDQRHLPGTGMEIRGHKTGTCVVQWQNGTDQMRRCWNDHEETTEHGAYGVAILLAELITGVTVTERSPKGTRFDFWLGEDNDEDLPFANKIRLEVTGIRTGNDSKIAVRMKQKFTRFGKVTHPLPAMVIVVEFGTPLSEVQQR